MAYEGLGALLNIIGTVSTLKRQKQSDENQKFGTLMDVFNTLGTSESYQNAQKMGAGIGIPMPNLPAPQPQQPMQQPMQGPMQGTGQDPFNLFLNLMQTAGPQPMAPSPVNVPQQQQQSMDPEVAEYVGQPRKYQDFADEVASEMGVDPNNLVGGEPLKKFRAETYKRYNTYLKERETTIRQLTLENRREKRQLKLEEEKEKGRLELEKEKERIGDERLKERERASDERQSAMEKAADARQNKAIAAQEKRLGRMLSAQEERAILREKGLDRRQSTREKGVESRFNRRSSDRKSEFQTRRADKAAGIGTAAKPEKKKLVTIYGPGGATKMVPISTEKEFAPPAGWSFEKPSKEEKQLQMLLGGGTTQGGLKKKIPVYDINGKIIRYEN